LGQLKGVDKNNTFQFLLAFKILGATVLGGLRCAGTSVSEISAFIRTLPSAGYILSDESIIPVYSTSNGYKNVPDEKG